MDIVTDGEGRPVLSEDAAGRPIAQVRTEIGTDWRLVAEVLEAQAPAQAQVLDVQLDGPEEAAQERELEIAVQVQEEVARQVAAEAQARREAREERDQDLADRRLRLREAAEARRRPQRGEVQQAEAEGEGPEVPFWVSPGGGCLGHFLIFVGATQIGGCISGQVYNATGGNPVAAVMPIFAGLVLWVYGWWRYGSWRQGEARRLQVRARLDAQAEAAQANTTQDREAV